VINKAFTLKIPLFEFEPITGGTPLTDDDAGKNIPAIKMAKPIGSLETLGSPVSPEITTSALTLVFDSQAKISCPRAYCNPFLPVCKNISLHIFPHRHLSSPIPALILLHYLRRALEHPRPDTWARFTFHVKLEQNRNSACVNIKGGAPKPNGP
jgi:hypothetical protein